MGTNVASIRMILREPVKERRAVLMIEAETLAECQYLAADAERGATGHGLDGHPTWGTWRGWEVIDREETER